MATLPEISVRAKAERLTQINRTLLENRLYAYRAKVGKFKPTWYQEAIHQGGMTKIGRGAIDMGRVAKERWCFMPNQVGKSLGGAADDLMLSYGIHPYIPVDVPNIGVVLTVSHLKSVQIMRRLIWDFVPQADKDMIMSHKHGCGFFNQNVEKPARLILPNGSQIHFMSADQDSMEFESLTLNWFHCLAEGQKVMMADGRWLPIEKVVPGDVVVGANTAYGKCSPRLAMVEKTACTGYKETLEVICNRGVRFVCTPEHKVYSCKKWVQAKDLVIGQPIKAPMVTLPRSRQTLENWLTSCLAVMLGDGNMTGKSPKFKCKRPDFLKEIKDAIEGTGLSVKHKKSSNEYFFVGTDKSINRNPLKVELERLGAWGKLAHDKVIPDEIFQQPDIVICRFLRFLYNCDGWISGQDKGKDTSITVGYCSVSKELAFQVSWLLRRLGIRSEVNFKKSQKPGRWRDQWWVTIQSARHILSFRDRIGILRERAEEIYDLAERRVSTRLKFYGKESFDPDMQRKMDNFVKVKEVRPVIGKRRVYDLLVPDTSNFLVQGGALVHNSDEEPPQEIYNQIQIRLLRHHGYLLCTMTPWQEEGSAGISWTADRVLHNNKLPPSQRSGEIWLAPYITMYEAPWLTKEAVEEWKKKVKSPEEYDARFKGVHMQRSGKIFRLYRDKFFNPKKPVESGHLLPTGFPINPNWTLMFLLDPSAPSGTTAGLWVAVTDAGMWQGIHFKGNELVFYREYKEKDLTVKKHVGNILGLNGHDALTRKFMDGRFMNQSADANAQKSYGQLYEENGLWCEPWIATLVATEIDSMQNYLQGTLDRTSSEPGVFFCQECVMLRKEIDRYIYPVHRSGDLKGERKPVQNKKQKNIHLLDCAKAACNLGLKHIRKHWEEELDYSQYQNPVTGM